MDSSPSISHMDRHRLNPYPRSTTINSHARLPTPQSSNASTHSMSSPQLSAAQPAYKISSTTTSKTTLTNSPRPSPVPREGGLELRPSAMSTYLQEKLEKERKDGEIAARRTPDLGDLRIPGSPIRMATPGRDRGTPVQGLDGEPTTKKGLGMGVKEMEVTVTTLHKQNFDLKLELYHRRERQQALESRLETVEGEKHQVEEMNDRLIEELEKRDKAVEEAVAMIVTLESQVESLLKERETIRRAETRIYEHQRRASEDYAAQQMQIQMQQQQQRQRTSASGEMDLPMPLPEAQMLRLPQDRVLNRMPSFLSDLSETTENLRNVYLSGAKNGSLMNLPRLNEALSEVDAIEASIPEKLRSPSLSMLSESSFASVYGADKDNDDDDDSEEILPIPPKHQHIGQSPFAPPPPPAHGERRHQNQTPRTSGVGLDPSNLTTPSRGQGRRKSSAQSKVTSIASISELMLDQSSPLQRLERSYGQRIPSGTSENSNQSHGQGQGLRPSKTLAHRKVRDDKRHSLRQVITDSPNRILHDSGMPPTPDTISTATLRHYQTESETMDRNAAIASVSTPLNMGVKHAGSNGSIGGVPVSMGTLTASGADGSSKLATGSTLGPNRSPQPRPIAGFSGRREPSGSYFDARPPSMAITRPHSAGASTIARYHDKDSYEYSDDNDDDDDDDDTRSLASSLDIWIREGGKAPRALGRGSPDLFSFPSHPNGQGWAPEVMFGPASGMAASGASKHPSSLFSTSPTLPQPPPDRRSSLLAQTGRHHRPQSTNMLSSEERSRKLQDDVSRPMSQPGNWQGKGKSGSATKNSPYPPPAQPHRQRGINNLWRRSLGNSGLMLANGGSLGVVSGSMEGGVSVRADRQMVETMAQDHQDKESETYGTAAWHRRNSLMAGNDNDKDRAGATPPPIARSRGQSIGQQQQDAAAYDSTTSVVSALSSTSVDSMKQTRTRSPLMSSMTVQTSFPPRSNANVGHGHSMSMSMSAAAAAAGAGSGSVPPTPATPGGTKKGWLSRFGRSNSVTKKEKEREREREREGNSN